jgi:lupus La protein
VPPSTELTGQKGFGEETPTLQVDLEKHFGGFGEIDSIRLRRTDTGLFKGSVFVQFRTLKDAEAYLAEPQEWNGSLLEVKTKQAYVDTKKEEHQNLSWDERRERDSKREQESRNQKRFSAFKEMEKAKAPKRENRKERGSKHDRRGRDNKPRDRSRSPPPVKDEPSEPATVDTAAGVKRPRSASPAGSAPSLFNTKREKLDDSEKAEDTQNGKRGAEEELNGEAKKVKVDEQ